MVYILYIVIGLLAGFLGGIVGVGGGIVVIPALTMLFGFSQLKAQGTSLAFLIFPVTIAAVYNYYKAGYVDMQVAIIIAIGFVIGSFFSSSIALGLPDNLLKKGFSIFLVLVALKLFFTK